MVHIIYSLTTRCLVCLLLIHYLLYVCRSEAAEKELQLRTKKMREKDELKTAVRHYRFVLLRIQFPDGIVLQGMYH